ncbi:MAG: PepSY-like domain-containing protein [Ferruginibacter sp.]|nr:PepSY-like domain-containing protein [Ferruginibacter sp.]
MKLTICLFALAASITVISCNNEKKQNQDITTTDSFTSVKDVAVKSTIEGTKKTITTQQVPDTIEYAFKEKYPTAVSPVWVEYTPIESDELAMDRNYYYVTFTDRGTDITSWYDNNGDWVKTSTKLPGDSRLPDAVNKTLNEQYPGYEIEEISKENDKNMDMYDIKLNKGEEKAKLKVLPNGEVFKRKEK